MERTMLRYINARPFLSRLHDAMEMGYVTLQDAIKLKGQALRGDIDGAEKGLARIMERQS